MHHPDKICLWIKLSEKVSLISHKSTCMCFTCLLTILDDELEITNEHILVSNNVWSMQVHTDRDSLV